MLINLTRTFNFQKEEEAYEVQYRFTRESGEASPGGDISLELQISVNDGPKKSHTVHKPTSTLYMSNESIEKMIEQELTVNS